MAAAGVSILLNLRGLVELIWCGRAWKMLRQAGSDYALLGFRRSLNDVSPLVMRHSCSALVARAVEFLMWEISGLNDEASRDC